MRGGSEISFRAQGTNYSVPGQWPVLHGPSGPGPGRPIDELRQLAPMVTPDSVGMLLKDGMANTPVTSPAGVFPFLVVVPETHLDRKSVV